MSPVSSAGLTDAPCRTAMERPRSASTAVASARVTSVPARAACSRCAPISATRLSPAIAASGTMPAAARSSRRRRSGSTCTLALGLGGELFAAAHRRGGELGLRLVAADDEHQQVLLLRLVVGHVHEAARHPDRKRDHVVRL